MSFIQSEFAYADYIEAKTEIKRSGAKISFEKTESVPGGGISVFLQVHVDDPAIKEFRTSAYLRLDGLTIVECPKSN